MSFILHGCVLAMLVTCAVSQAAHDLCSYNSGSMMDSMQMPSEASVHAKTDSPWSAEGACKCVVTPRFNSSISSVSIGLTIAMKMPEGKDKQEDGCLPMIQVDTTGPQDVSYLMCAALEGTGEHQATLEVYQSQTLTFHMYNPDKIDISNMVFIKQNRGAFSISCEGTTRLEYDPCPCMTIRAAVPGGAGGVTFDEGRRLMIGLVTAFVFVLVIVAIIVGWVFYKKRRTKKEKEEKDREAAVASNKAYQGSSASVGVNDPKHASKKDAKISYSPDPNLNLELQKPGGHKGSKDSGLASSNDDNKRLPFMQPIRGNASSLDNLTAMPENYPPIAGHGSQSSLDNAVDPVYVTRASDPRRLAPGPGPRAGQPKDSNFPPLAGHGSQSSLDNPGFYHTDVDVTYAQPMKRPEQQRSASVDRLNAAGMPSGLDRAHHASGEDLNASRVTIETDV